MSTTVKDNASVTSGTGFFKRLSRKRSIGASSPKSPSSPISDSAPFLPPLAGLDLDPLPPTGTASPPATPAANARSTRLSTVGAAPPFLNLPGDIAPPVSAPTASTYTAPKPSKPTPKPVPIVKGGPQLPPPKAIDTSLNLDFTPTGFLALPSANTPKDEKKEAELGTAKRAASPNPSANRATSPSPNVTPSKSRKEPSTTSEKTTSDKSTLSKTFGALFKRGKSSKEPSDLLSQTPVEEKRKSATGPLAALKRNSINLSADKKDEKKETAPKTNGVAKETPSAPAEAETVKAPALVGAAAAAAAVPVTTAAAVNSAPKPAEEEQPAATDGGFAPSGTTFTTNDGQVKTFGEAAPEGGFARPAGFEHKPIAELAAAPVPEEDETMEPVPEAELAGFAQSGTTFTTDDGEVKTFGEAAPEGGFARPAGFEKKSIAELAAAPVEEAEDEPEPVAEVVAAEETPAVAEETPAPVEEAPVEEAPVEEAKVEEPVEEPAPTPAVEEPAPAPAVEGPAPVTAEEQAVVENGTVPEAKPKAENGHVHKTEDADEQLSSL